MLKKYLLNTSGNFGMMFAVCTTMLIGGIGVAIDTTGLTKHKASMQNLADMGALAASASSLTDEGEIEALAKETVSANNLRGLDLNTDVTFENEHIQVYVSTKYNPFILGFFGKKSLDVSAVSETPQKEDIPINISLVLDTTDSMEGANLTSMQSAVGKLVTAFKEMENDLRVAVVPFSDYVNVGMANRNANWMYVEADSSTTITPDCYMKQDRVCSGGYSTVTETRYRDGVPYEASWNTCNGWSDDGAPYNYCPAPYTSYQTWSGCAGSRDSNRHKEPRHNGKDIPGIMNETCGSEVLPLTSDMTAVANKIDELSTDGSTYLPAGLIWGWRMLDSKEPFDDLSNTEAKRQRALVLMTDGKNTLSLNQPKHNGSDETAANALTAELCESIKAENIQLYAVAYKFDGGDATAKSIVQQCATKPDMFFDAQNQAELESAFEDIGRALFTVRLTR